MKPCHNSKPHNFRTCPFGHPPNWIRRDPRQCRYVPVPCPYHQAGSCTLDGCPYAHSLLECSLHPYNYRNSRCRHGSRCTETVCFFAHSDHELRKPSKQYSPTLEEFKAAEELRPAIDRAKVDHGTLSAAEAKARTLLRSSSPPPPPPTNLMPRPGNGFEHHGGPAPGSWAALAHGQQLGSGPWAEPGGIGIGIGGPLGTAPHHNGNGPHAAGTPTKGAFPWLGSGDAGATWQPPNSNVPAASEGVDWSAASGGLQLDNLGHLMNMMQLQQPPQGAAVATNGAAASNAPGSVASNTTSAAAKEEATGDLDWDTSELQQLVQQATAQ